jgi:dipeptide/tripeptide permease
MDKIHIRIGSATDNQLVIEGAGIDAYHIELFADTEGNLLVGSYAALVYAMPVIGGFLADKYLCFRKAIVFVGI